MMGGSLHIADRTDGVSGVVLSLRLPLQVPEPISGVRSPHTGDTRAICGASAASMYPDSADAPRALTCATPAEPMRGRRVLLVDDSSGNRRVGERMLVALGVKPSLASDGDEVSGAVAAAAAAGAPFDAIMLDIWMVRMHGDAATAALRAAGCAIPILAVTANVSAAEREAYLAGGFTGVLGKPFSKEELQAALERVVR